MKFHGSSGIVALGMLLVCAGCGVALPAEGAAKPNFVIILSDDQGYGDLSCMGCKDVRTPNIDTLATDGSLLTNFYANAAVCSPSRAALLTGRYPGNAGVRCNLGRLRNSAQGLWPEVPTIADGLKELGYSTEMAGKWHEGCIETCRPNHHGFDRWFGCTSGALDYFSHISFYGPDKGPGYQPTHDLWEDDQEVWENGRYMTELITEHAVGYIRENAKAKQPFFLYVAYTAVHYPLHAPRKYEDRYPNLPPERRSMAAMIAALDHGVGEILGELDKQNLRDNTVVFFMSDNGPTREYRAWLDGRAEPYFGGSAGKLKGAKESLYDGGIRVPAIMRWPGRVAPGQTNSQVAAAMDLFPTFLHIAGGDPAKYEFDGQDIAPMLTEGTPTPHDQIFWERCEQTAVRRGKWKLVLNGELVGEKPAPGDEVHLSDLDADMGERINLSKKYPELTSELTEAALSWRKKMDQRWTEQWKPRIKDPFILGKPITLDESTAPSKSVKPEAG